MSVTFRVIYPYASYSATPKNMSKYESVMKARFIYISIYASGFNTRGDNKP